jgi:hypothetical protein
MDDSIALRLDGSLTLSKDGSKNQRFFGWLSFAGDLVSLSTMEVGLAPVVGNI